MPIGLIIAVLVLVCALGLIFFVKGAGVKLYSLVTILAAAGDIIG